VASADAAAFLQMSLPVRAPSPFSGMVAEASPFGGDGVAINRVKVALAVSSTRPTRARS
jgi:hypothetical protein